MTRDPDSGRARRRTASGGGSPWGSEESRDFLQERIARFARLLFFLNLFFFVAGWIVSLVWQPSTLVRGLPLATPHLFHIAYSVVLLAMWLAAANGPVPPAILHAIDGGGVVAVAALLIAMCCALPILLRPDLVATLALFGILLYRAAIVPSEPARTAWIGALSVAPLPVATYLMYERAVRPAEMPAPAAYAVYAGLFGGLAVLLSTRVSSDIYGLRQTVREARRLGPYTLVEKIGEGGMGAVYRASHSLLRRPTAIKILPPERAGEMDLARFEREVQMTSQLTSPHTVSVYDYGRTPDGLFYYAMEYLDGIDLDELVRADGPMPAGRVVHVLRQVCEALGEAHRVGLIHRDIKPANILLCERGGRPDVAKVVDFGLVKSVEATDARVTLENTALGTPHYMAPEALRSPERIDVRCDIYALGATAYFLLTGSTVFEGNLGEVMTKLLRDEPVAPSVRAGRTLPASIEALVLAALAKDPEDRPESAEAVQAALASALDVPPWPAAEAAAWWRTRGARIRARRSGAREPDEGRPRTLDIRREGAVP